MAKNGQKWLQPDNPVDRLTRFLHLRPAAPGPSKECLREASPLSYPPSLSQYPTTPQRDALLSPPTLNLTPSSPPVLPLETTSLDQGDALLSPQWQDDKSKEDFPVKEPKDLGETEEEESSDVEEEEEEEEEEKSKDWADQVEEEESKEIPSVASYRWRWSGWEEKVFRTEAKEVLQLERKKRGPEQRWSKEQSREIVLGLKSWQDLKPRRVQALCACVGREETQLSFEPGIKGKTVGSIIAGSIIAVHGLSDKIPGRMIVTLDGTKWDLPSASVHDGAPTVEILDWQ